MRASGKHFAVQSGGAVWLKAGARQTRSASHPPAGLGPKSRLGVTLRVRNWNIGIQPARTAPSKSQPAACRLHLCSGSRLPGAGLGFGVIESRRSSGKRAGTNLRSDRKDLGFRGTVPFKQSPSLRIMKRATLRVVGELRKMGPNVRVTTVAATHDLPIEKPEVVVDAVRSVLRRIAEPDAEPSPSRQADAG